MRIILSRKGFDASAGGVASPILPEGSLISLPIPDPASRIRYNDLSIHNYELGNIVADLSRERINRQHFAHLDPDLDGGTYPREMGWRPLFGQEGAALGHLVNEGVGEGDLFLFFGWFRQVQFVKGHYQFIREAPDLHVIFGWLQVGGTLSGKQLAKNAPPWVKYHPHCYRLQSDKNKIFVAADELNLGLGPTVRPGAGLIKQYRSNLQLTSADSSRRSLWRLPFWLFPDDGKPALSYNKNLSRWSRAGDHVTLQSAGRGQEFVLDTSHYPEAIGWAQELIAYHQANTN
jgi:hypothetical protein